MGNPVEIPKELHNPLPQNDKMFAGFDLMYQLHKKGFDMKCENIFISWPTTMKNLETGEMYLNNSIERVSIESEEAAKDYIADCKNAATWQEILQWFREQHYIFIEIQSSAPNLKCAYTVMKYKYIEKEAAFKQVSYKTAYPRDTYEEAVLDGINHAMKLI